MIYRIQNGFDNRDIYCSVVIQQMIFPKASGIVSADNYKVRAERITDNTISQKKMAILAIKNGGTEVQTIKEAR